MRTLQRLSFLAAFFFVIAYQADGQTGLSASPMKLTFEAAAGGTQQKTILLRNLSDAKMAVTVSLNDWRRDSLGQIQFKTSGTLKNSCAEWLQVLPETNFTLAPHEQKQITVFLKAPKNIQPVGHHAMVMFTQQNPRRSSTQKNGVNILMKVQIGVQVFYNPPGAAKKEITIAGFRDTTVTTKGSDHRALWLQLKNTGTLETDGKVNFKLYNLKTGKKFTLEQKKFYTLPGAVYIVREALPTGLKTGIYSVVATVDYGAQYELKIGQLKFRQH